MKEAQAYEKCSQYEPTYNDTEMMTCYDEDSFNRSVQIACQDYVYDRTIFEETLTTELNLVCDQDYKTKLFGTVLMLGILAGNLFGGILTDKFGRKTVLLWSNIFMSPCIIAGGFIPIYEVYLTLHFLALTFNCMMWVSGHALLLELFGKERRKMAFCLFNVGWLLAAMILPLVAYLERYWSYLHLYIGLLTTISIPGNVFLLHESTRWMILNGKDEEAEKTLHKIARWNKRHLSENDALEMNHIVEKMAEKAQFKHEQNLSPLQMFKPSLLLTTLITLSIWITSVLSTYALLLNVTSLAGDIFLNSVIGSLFELCSPLFIFLCLDRIGRRFSIIVCQVLVGCCCIVMAFVPKNYSSVIMAMYFLGRICSSTTLTIAWFYTAELYPTNLRAQAVATCSLIARIFGMFSSFIVKLGVYWSPLPMLILGVPALFSGLLTLKLPETSKRRLIEMTENVDDKEWDEKELKVVEPM